MYIATCGVCNFNKKSNRNVKILRVEDGKEYLIED